MNRDFEAALETVELDCAFALFWFSRGDPDELRAHGAHGVRGWAAEHYPEALSRMVAAVEAAMRAELEKLCAPGVLTPAQVTHELTGIGVDVEADTERPGLNNPDGSTDFEVE